MNRCHFVAGRQVELAQDRTRWSFRTLLHLDRVRLQKTRPDLRYIQAEIAHQERLQVNLEQNIKRKLLRKNRI